jgi:hypothetical protein
MGEEERRWPIGVYERVVTRALDQEIGALAEAELVAELAVVDDAEMAPTLVRHVAAVTRRVLAGVAEPDARLNTAGKLLDVLSGPGMPDEAVSAPLRLHGRAAVASRTRPAPGCHTGAGRWAVGPPGERPR